MILNSKFGEAYKCKIQECLEKVYAVKLNREEIKNISDNSGYFLILECLHSVNQSSDLYSTLRQVINVYHLIHVFNLSLINNSIFGVLYKFREGKFGIAGDITEMFHMVNIREEDRGFQCFLCRDCDKKRDPDVYMIAMIFGTTCSLRAQYIKNGKFNGNISWSFLEYKRR